MNEVLHKPMDTVMLMRAVGLHVASARKGLS
jgi:hypothetical protein